MLIKKSTRHYHLVVSADCQLHQVVHKGLQADVVGENGLCGLADAAVCARRVRGRGVELGEEETCLRTTGVADNETRQREAILDEFLQKCE